MPVTALQALLEVPARLGAGEHYDDVMNTVETHCAAYVLGTEQPLSRISNEQNQPITNKRP